MHMHAHNYSYLATIQEISYSLLDHGACSELENRAQCCLNVKLSSDIKAPYIIYLKNHALMAPPPPINLAISWVIDMPSYGV